MTLNQWSGHRCAECGNPTIINAGGRWLCTDHVKPTLAAIRARVETEWNTSQLNTP